MIKTAEDLALEAGMSLYCQEHGMDKEAFIGDIWNWIKKQKWLRELWKSGWGRALIGGLGGAGIGGLLGGRRGALGGGMAGAGLGYFAHGPKGRGWGAFDWLDKQQADKAQRVGKTQPTPSSTVTSQKAQLTRQPLTTIPQKSQSTRQQREMARRKREAERRKMEQKQFAPGMFT